MFPVLSKALRTRSESRDQNFYYGQLLKLSHPLIHVSTVNLNVKIISMSLELRLSILKIALIK